LKFKKKILHSFLFIGKYNFRIESLVEYRNVLICLFFLRKSFKGNYIHGGLSTPHFQKAKYKGLN
jgi:hypothetical protein